MIKVRILFLLCLIFVGCVQEHSTDYPENSNFELYITGVLEPDGKRTLPIDENRYYHLTLDRSKLQTIRRVTGIITANGNSPYPYEKVEWKSNLYWWLLRGDTVAQVTKTYFNPYSGELQQVTLPPLLAGIDELVPTINCCSYNSSGGEINTMIAPINTMVGDTLIVEVEHSSSGKRAIAKIVLE
jgi:hypothetical protein